jgi:hypothetical protein
MSKLPEETEDTAYYKWMKVILLYESQILDYIYNNTFVNADGKLLTSVTDSLIEMVNRQEKMNDFLENLIEWEVQ